MAAIVKYVILLLMVYIYFAESQQDDSQTPGNNGTAVPVSAEPDPPEPRGPKGTNNLPPLPSDTQSGNQNNQPKQHRPPAPAVTPMPSDIPLPGNPLPAPLPDELPSMTMKPWEESVPIIIGPDYFCEKSPPIPIPTPQNCPTCQGACGTTACVNDNCAAKIFCSCDHLCLFFDDCCEEFVEHCPVDYDKAINMQNSLSKFQNLTEDCFNIRTAGAKTQKQRFKVGTPMVAKCPNGDECPMADRDWELKSNLNELIPIMDPHTGLNFVSYECAKCNGVDHAIPWEAQVDLMQPSGITTNDLPFIDYSLVTSIKYQQDLDVLLKKHYSRLLTVHGISVTPPNLAPIRYCPRYPVIDTCSETCNQNQELVELCTNSATIYSIIDFEIQRTFKNYYCALCAWNDNMRTFAQPSFESHLVCGKEQFLRSAAAEITSPIVLDIELQFDSETGVTLPHKIMDYCEMKPKDLMPEPVGCPTCQGKCGTVTKLFPAPNLHLDPETRIWCSCDPECLFYNDCCDRFVLYCPTEWDQGIALLQNLSEYKGAPKCFPSRIGLLGQVDIIETPMVYTCRDEEETSCTDMLKYHDHRRFNLRENVAEYIPVTDLETGIHYASVECARCNNISKFELWTTTVNLEEDLRWRMPGVDGRKWSELHLETQLPILQNLSEAGVTNIPAVTFSPPDGTVLRHCYKGYSGSVPFVKVYDKCPDSCVNEKLRDLCENGNTLYSKFLYKPNDLFLPHWNRVDPTFKNFHCAMCYYNRTMEQLCGENVPSQILCGAVGKEGPEGTKVNVGTMSLTLVFDFNIQQGEQVGHSGSGTNSERKTNDTDLQVLGIITIICMSISIICLLIRIAFQFCIPFFWSLAGRMQVQLAIALLISFVFVLIGAFVEDYHSFCYFCSVVKNFGFLATFSWMSAISFITWKIFGTDSIKHKPKTNKYNLSKISVPVWLIPTLLTAFTIMMDFVVIDNSFSPSFAQNLCWYNQRYALLMYFGIPIALCLIANIILFILTAIQLRKAFRNSKAVSKQEQKNFQVYIRLCLLMGITWILGFITPFVDHVVLNSLFVILNALQGLFLFIAFVCQKKIWDFISMKSHAHDLSSSNPSSGSSSSNTKYKTTTTELKNDVKRKYNVELKNL